MPHTVAPRRRLDSGTYDPSGVDKIGPAEEVLASTPDEMIVLDTLLPSKEK
jgi:hypothetical protein